VRIGIGENNPDLRAQACAEQVQIGIEIDADKNADASAKERLISTKDSRVQVFVIATDEEAAIANDTYELTK
jgi:acetate kinase